MLTLHNGWQVSEYIAATALALEARRQTLSYGRLVANTDWWEQEEIVIAYMKKKRARSRCRGRAAGKGAVNEK